MQALNLFISVFLTGLLFIVIWNMFVFRKRKYREIPEKELPFVSVLIPARNEEANIKNCAESLLNQDYPFFEVLVLNDNSDDNTSDILNELSAKYPELKVINGNPLPEGWTGKNYACHRLYRESKGDYLLFTDADTVHFRDSLRKAVTRSVSRNADLYTLVPEMTLKSFSEKYFMPVLHFTSFTLLPYYLAEKLKSPMFAMGAGPFMLFKRESYEKIGGHAAEKSEIVEDVRLAKNIKKHGLKVIVNKGVDVFSCRMYTSFGEIWDGFSKNIYPGLNYSAASLFAVFSIYLLMFFVPFVTLAAGLITGNTGVTINSTYQIFLLVIMRLIINYNFKLGYISVIMHPVSVLITAAIAFNSWKWNTFGKGSYWKGRIYPHTEQGDKNLKTAGKII